MQVIKKFNKIVQELNLPKDDTLDEKNIEENIDLDNDCKSDSSKNVESVSIRLIDSRENFYFHVNNKQLDRTAISQEEMDCLYDWLTKENTTSYAVTCNDKTKIILIRNSILYVAAK